MKKEDLLFDIECINIEEIENTFRGSEVGGGFSVVTHAEPIFQTKNKPGFEFIEYLHCVEKEYNTFVFKINNSYFIATLPSIKDVRPYSVFTDISIKQRKNFRIWGKFKVGYINGIMQLLDILPRLKHVGFLSPY